MDVLDFNWDTFYKELSSKLLEYKSNRKDLVVIVEKCFSENNIKMFTLENGPLIDIDPFTVFGLFNRQMKNEKRILIANTLKKYLNVDCDVPNSFNGVPVLTNQNATYYWFVGHRSENDIDDLWCLFENALNYSINETAENKESFVQSFDKCVNKKGNGTGKITMGLYWINPSFYLNLDGRNFWYIYDSNKLPIEFVKTLPNDKFNTKLPGKAYIEILDKVKNHISNNDDIDSLKHLSYLAWTFANEVNAQNKLLEKNVENIVQLDDTTDGIRYWIYSPGQGASEWEKFYENGVMGIGESKIGDLTIYNSKEEIKKAMKENYGPGLSYDQRGHICWQFANEMKPGDIVFVKKGRFKIVGRGIVESNYYFDDKFEEGYNNYRKVRWVNKGEWNHPGHAAMKTLTDITRYTDYVEKLKQLFVDDEELDEEEVVQYSELYSEQDFLNDAFITENEYHLLKSLIIKKKNIILQGPPGVGKTYISKLLAYSLMGKKDKDKVAMVQFHQSYSYEDFIEGFRPNNDGGFILKKGIFYKFCMKALVDSENDYYFIIDEINRGNLSKIFGELFMLIEADKRNMELPLLYSGDIFTVPSNVHIIGLMNTADRSLAMLDYALRRRFAFFTIKPGFESSGFKKYKESFNNDKFNKLVDVTSSLNEVICNDDTLGEGFEIGHSYFCNFKNNENELSNIIEYELIPLLKEYWFDEPNKVKEWSYKLRDILK